MLHVFYPCIYQCLENLLTMVVVDHSAIKHFTFVLVFLWILFARGYILSKYLFKESLLFLIKLYLLWIFVFVFYVKTCISSLTHLKCCFLIFFLFSSKNTMITFYLFYLLTDFDQFNLFSPLVPHHDYIDWYFLGAIAQNFWWAQFFHPQCFLPGTYSKSYIDVL